MINLMLQGRQPIIYGDGNQKRCFSFVDDDVFCLKEMVYRKDVVGEIINIGPDEDFITINKLAETIAELIGFDLKPVYVPGLGHRKLSLPLAQPTKRVSYWAIQQRCL